MSSPLIATPQALDAAIVASRQIHRERLVRAVRNQRIRTWVACWMTGCIVFFAFLAFFVAHDLEAARVLSVIAVITGFIVAIAGSAGRKRALNALKEIDLLN
jgi:hypothetical protein